MFSKFPVILPFTLALRNMRTRLWRTALTMLGIVLGVAVVLAIQITNDSTLESIRQVFDRAAGRANLLVVAEGSGAGSTNAFDEEIWEDLEGIDSIEIAAPTIRTQTVLASEAGRTSFDFTITGVASGSIIQLYGIDPELDPEVRVYELASGRLPNLEDYEAVLPEELAEEKRLGIGDDLVIVTPLGEAHLEITGLLTKEGVALINDGNIAIAPLEVIQELFEREGELDEIGLRVAPETAENPRQLEALKDYLETDLEGDAEVIYPSARGELVPMMLSTYQQGLAFFSLIAVFVGAFLIYNTFSMTVVERTREIGMLRAIGMSRLQIIRMVMAEAGILAFLGSGVGLLLGIVLARGLIRLMGGVIAAGGETVITLPLVGVLQSLLVGVGVTLGAAFLPAYSASRTSPLEALRARSRSGQGVRSGVWIAGLFFMVGGFLAIYQVPWRQEVVFGAGSTALLAILLGATLTVPLVVTTLEKFTRPISKLIYNNEGSLGSSNVRRSVGRTTLTVAALMVALTMVIGIGSLAYSFEQDITQWIDTALGGDLYVRSPVPLRESFNNQLANVPGVEAITAARYISVQVVEASSSGSSENLTYNAIEPETYRQVGDIEFSIGQGNPEDNWQRLAQGEAIFISNSVADRYNLQKGDELLLQTRRGERAFEVAAEVVDFTGQGLVVIGTYDDLHSWFADSGVDRFTLNVSSGYSVEAVAEEIENRFADRNHVTAETTEIFKEKIRDLMRRSFRLFDVLNLIAVIIGALGVINTLTMNVIERRREIGGLRSLGMTKSQVLRMVLAESMAMGMIGGLYGLAFGWAIAQALILGMNMLNGYELEYIFTAWPFILGLLISFLVSQVAALVPARGAAGVNIVEAIKHE